MLAVTALVSIGTKSISVSAPYSARGAALSKADALVLVVYRDVEGDSPAALSLRELRDDLAFLAGGVVAALSERELVAAIRHESPLPGTPLLLLFDESTDVFEAKIEQLLNEQGVPWMPLEKSALLSQELRVAGYPVTRLERTSGFTLEEQLKFNS